MIAALLLTALLQEPPPPPRPRPRPPAAEEEPPVFQRDAEEQPVPPGRAPSRPGGGPALEETKAWLRENEPETYRRVMRAIEEGRRPEASRLLAEAEPRVREMAEMKTRDPKAFERLQELRRLERETLDIAERARGARPEDREAAARILKEKLDRLFDLREDVKAHELEELKRRVADVEKQLEARKAAKERIVDRRKRELLGERLQDDW